MNHTAFQAVHIEPQSCPKFSDCNAPICPLDPGHLDRVYIRGEPICQYLYPTHQLRGIETEIRRAACIATKEMYRRFPAVNIRIERLQRLAKRPNPKQHGWRAAS